MAILGEKTEGVPGVENKESTTTPTATTTTTTATTNTPYNSGSNDKEASFGIPLAQRQPSALSAASSKHSAVAGIGASDVRGGDWSGNGDENDVPADGKYTHRHGHELPFSKARSIALVATVTGAAFLNTLCIQSVVIILPSIGHDLSVPESRQQWIVSSYSLTFGCFLLFWGRVADIYGKRLIFIIGSFWVTAMTAVNPFLPNEIAFNIFRALHGLGSAANVPTAIGILGVTFPPGKAKNYAFSAYAAGAPLGSIFGNLLSGLIAEFASWKWVFGALAIMAGIISVAGILFIPSPIASTVESQISGHNAQHEKPKRAAIDWIGSVLITVGLLALMFALTEGNVVGWSTPWIPALIVVSIVIIAAFVVWQWHLERALNKEKQTAYLDTGGRPDVVKIQAVTPPLIKVSIFCNLRFSAVMIIMGLFFASFNNYLIYATYYFQGFQGLSPLQTMLRFIPTGVGGSIIALIVAQLLHRVPTFFILICGSLAMALATLLYAVPIPPTTSYFAWGMPAMLLAVLGADTTWPCVTLFTSQALPREDQAIGGALINAVSQFGRAFGLAISTAIQTAVMADARGLPVQDVGSIRAWDYNSLKGIRAASWMNFGFGMAALAVVLMAFRGMEIVGKAAPPVLPAQTEQTGEAIISVDSDRRNSSRNLE